MLEKRFAAIPPQSFTMDGTVGGIVTVIDASIFKVKQQVIITATGQPILDNLEIKRIVSHTSFIVGPPGAITLYSNLSAYTVAAGASIKANEQKRPTIIADDFERACYEEEPTVAKRVVAVDKWGDKFDYDNPIPTVDVGSAADHDWDDLVLTRDAVTQDITVATYKKNGVAVRTLDLTYDANENLQEVQKS